MGSIRTAFVLAAIVPFVVSCSKSTAATAPLISDSLSVAGAWTGCVAQSGTACTPVSMTLTDSVTTDSTETVAGTGQWLETVAIKGKLTDARLTLSGTATNVVEGWSFAGALSGSSLSGTMTIPGQASSYSAVFTRSP
jgi:hypothetical protein